jgi:hypothetical protein
VRWAMLRAKASERALEKAPALLSQPR